MENRHVQRDIPKHHASACVAIIASVNKCACDHRRGRKGPTLLCKYVRVTRFYNDEEEPV